MKYAYVIEAASYGFIAAFFLLRAASPARAERTGTILAGQMLA